MENQIDNEGGEGAKRESMEATSSDDKVINIDVNKAEENSLDKPDDHESDEISEKDESDELLQLEEEKKELEKAVAESKDRYLRVVADMENLRRRTEKEK